MSDKLYIERSGYGLGFSEQEALVDWLSTDPQFIVDDKSIGTTAIDQDIPVAVKVVKKPKVSKRPRITRHSLTGKKWSTEWVVSNQSEILSRVASKTEAIKLAKQHAIDGRTSVTVKKEKACEGGNVVAHIEAPTAQPGRYHFKASFKF